MRAIHLPKGTPYEFGCKVSIATPATKPKGGQFVLHSKVLHGNPFDGHTERQTGVTTCRIRLSIANPHVSLEVRRPTVTESVTRIHAGFTVIVSNCGHVDPRVGASNVPAEGTPLS